MHHIADVFAGDHDEDIHHRLADFLDALRVGEKRRVIDDHLGAVSHRNVIDHRRIGGDDIHVELAPQALLDDLHVQQTEEATTEAKAKRRRAFRRIGEGGVVDLELAHGELECLVVRGIHRIDAGENHRLDFLVAGKRLGAGVGIVGHRIADFHLTGRLHVGDDIADIAR